MSRYCIIGKLILSGTYDVKKDSDGHLYIDPKGTRGYYSQIRLFVISKRLISFCMYLTMIATSFLYNLMMIMCKQM